MSARPVNLGERYRDTITGFEGVATSRHEYMFGCVRVTLEGRSTDDKAPEELIFDEQRLEELPVRGYKLPPTMATTGGSRSTPPRTGMR